MRRKGDETTDEKEATSGKEKKFVKKREKRGKTEFDLLLGPRPEGWDPGKQPQRDAQHTFPSNLPSIFFCQ